MRKTWYIAVREYNAAVRSKAFIVSMVLMPVFMVGGIVVQKIMKGKVDTTDKTIAVIDHTGQLCEAIEAAATAYNENELLDPKSGKKIKPKYIIERIEPNDDDPDKQRVELSNRIRANKLHAFVEIGKDVIEPKSDPHANLDILPMSERVVYHGERAAIDDVRGWVREVVNKRIRELRLAKVDMAADVVERLTRFVPVEPHGLLSLKYTKQLPLVLIGILFKQSKKSILT